MDPSGDETLRRVLERHRTLGSLGRAPVDDHLRQGAAIAAQIGPATDLVIDLGSGGGVPGLVVGAMVDCHLVLVERRERRADALELALTELGWRERAEVRTEDVTETARSDRRGCADVVLARSFGPPAVVAEYGAPLLRPGGRLIVTGPPAPRPWPAEGLARVGLGPLEWSVVDGYVLGVATLTAPTSDEHPRRGDQPRRRPLFDVDD